MSSALNLTTIEKYKVPGIPDTIYYIPDYITEAEEERLTRNVYNSPKPKWTQLSHRRLQNWGGVPLQKGMVTETIPEWLNSYCGRISDIGVFDGKSANHVLVNEYKSGEGIMPHLDGDLYYPTVSTISLGSHTVLNFYKPAENSSDGSETDEPPSDSTETHAHPSPIFSQRHVASILLERRSLVLVRDDMYKTYLHGITEITEDVIASNIANLDLCKVETGSTLSRDTRISLTIRHVPKTIKLKFLFGKR